MLGLLLRLRQKILHGDDHYEDKQKSQQEPLLRTRIALRIAVFGQRLILN